MNSLIWEALPVRGWVKLCRVPVVLEYVVAGICREHRYSQESLTYAVIILPQDYLCTVDPLVIS